MVSLIANEICDMLGNKMFSLTTKVRLVSKTILWSPLFFIVLLCLRLFNDHFYSAHYAHILEIVPSPTQSPTGPQTTVQLYNPKMFGTKIRIEWQMLGWTHILEIGFSPPSTLKQRKYLYFCI